MGTIGLSTIFIIITSLVALRIMPNKTDVDVYFLVFVILWVLVEAGNNEKEYPELVTTVRRVGLTVSVGYLFWISIYYIN